MKGSSTKWSPLSGFEGQQKLRCQRPAGGPWWELWASVQSSGGSMVVSVGVLLQGHVAIVPVWGSSESLLEFCEPPDTL